MNKKAQIYIVIACLVASLLLNALLIRRLRNAASIIHSSADQIEAQREIDQRINEIRNAEKLKTPSANKEQP